MCILHYAFQRIIEYILLTTYYPLQSNKISFVGQDSGSAKSIIRYSNTVNVLKRPLTIWCESDSSVDQCTLRHQQTSEIKCKWNATMKYAGSCGNPTHSYKLDSNQNCTFTLNSVTETGG